MGAWGHGPFDNDTAADFAAELRHAADLPTRTQVLLTTLRTVVFGTEVEISDGEPGLYELDYRVERAVAAVAFTADMARGRCHHTDNAFARGVAKDDEHLNPPVELEPVSPELAATCMALLDWVTHRLVLDDAGKEFTAVLDSLREDVGCAITA